jgi:Secretion system C-terminal sorting domain
MNTKIQSLATKSSFYNLLLLLLFSQNNLHAQSWQWLKAGGNYNSDGNYSEKIEHMESDPQGNLYVAFKQVTGNMIATPFSISGVQIPHYSDRDNILASFGCDGTLRWTVAIGGSNVMDPPFPISFIRNGTQIKSLKTDAQGNVYISGILNRGSLASEPFHFSPTFTLPTSDIYTNTYKENFFIAKYNSNGVFQWVRFPEPTNVALNNNVNRAALIHMDVDPNGMVHLDAFFAPGVFCSGALTITGAPDSFKRGILKYDTNGNYVGYAPFDYSDYADLLTHFLHDPVFDRYYVAKMIAASDAPSIIGGQLQVNSMYVAAFDNNGQFLWKKEDNNPNINLVFSPDQNCISLDTEGNLYMNCGLGILDVNDLTLVNSWNGQPIIPPANWNNISVPTVVKMNPNGDTIWMRNGTEPNFQTYVNRSVISGNELAISLGSKAFSWEGISLVTNATNGGEPGILRLNKDTGVGISAAFLTSNTGGLIASTIAAGPNGSYYLGGNFTSTISTSTSGSPATVSTGGYDDFFIAKFGSNNCTLATSAPTQKDVIQLYPNPVTTVLYLNNKETITYFIYDALGKKVQMNTLEANGSIDLQYLTQGIYLLQMTDGNGTVTTQKIIKD